MESANKLAYVTHVSSPNFHQTAKIGKTNPTNPTEVILRDWQSEGIQSYFSSDNSHGIMNAPTGSGKSTYMKAHIFESLSKNSHKKAIISVPKRIIGGGFVGKDNEIAKFTLLNGEIHTWKILPQNDAVTANGDDGLRKAQMLIEFLKNPVGPNLRDRVFLITHTSLVLAFKEMQKRHTLKKNLSDTLLWIDEAHHVADLSDDYKNGMGEVSSYYLKNTSRGQNLFLATATLHRGDGCTIVRKIDKKRFHEFFLDYARHFSENCKGLCFEYTALVSKDKWINSVRELFAKKIGKTIVFIPHTTSKDAEKCKNGTVKKILGAIAGVKKYDGHVDPVTGMITLKSHIDGKHVVVCDLVRFNDKKKLRAAQDNFLLNHSDSVDVVIGMGIPKEGFDWPCANREIIIGQRNSLVDLIQMAGRCFRQHSSKDNGKTVVEIIQLLGNVDESRYEESQAFDIMNGYFKTFLVSICLNDLVNPHESKLVTKNSSGKSRNKEPQFVREYIRGLMDDTSQSELFERITCKVVKFHDANPTMPIVERNEKYLDVIVKSIKEINKNKNLKHLHIPKNHTEVAEYLLEKFDRATRRNVIEQNLGIDANEKLGGDVLLVDKSGNYDKMGYLVVFKSIVHSATTLSEIIERISSYGKDFVSYEDAKKALIPFGLKSEKEFRAFTKTPEFQSLNIPANPQQYYKRIGTWLGWGDFLGTGNVATKDFVSYEDAKKALIPFGLKSAKEYKKFTKTPEFQSLLNIPANPQGYYNRIGTWLSWGDFLGTGNKRGYNKNNA